MKKYTLLYLVAILSASSLQAQQDQLIYTYRQMAVEYQQQIKIAQSDLVGAQSLAEAAKSDFLPKLDFGGSYKYLGVPVQLGVAEPGQQGDELESLYSFDLMVFQPVLTGGYLKNNRGAALSQVEIMRNYVNLNKQDVMFNADAMYWDAVSKKEANTILIEYRDAISQFLTVIQDRVDEEVVGPNELYQTKVRFNNAEYEVLRTNKEYAISVMKLNRLVGLPIDNELSIAESLEIVSWVRVDEDFTEKALTQRPEINILENKVSLNEFNEKITASKYNPQFGVGAGGNWGSPGPGLTADPDFNYNVYAQLVIPVFHWGIKNKEVFASRQLTEVAKLEMEQTKEIIDLEVKSSYKDLQLTQEQLNLALNSKTNAQSNVDVMLDRYYEGLSSVLEVLEAQLDLQKTNFNYVQAKLELNYAYTSYLHAMGELSVTQ